MSSRVNQDEQTNTSFYYSYRPAKRGTPVPLNECGSEIRNSLAARPTLKLKHAFARVTGINRCGEPSIPPIIHEHLQNTICTYTESPSKVDDGQIILLPIIRDFDSSSPIAEHTSLPSSSSSSSSPLPRSSTIPAGFPRYPSLPGSRSFVLLAACSSSEVAWEDEGRGRFTKALLQTLQSSEGLDLTYSELMKRLPRLTG